MLYFSTVWLYQSSINVEIHSWIIPLSTGLGHVIIRMILNYKFFSSIWLRNLRTLWIEKWFSVFGALYFEKKYPTFGQIMKKSHIFRVQDDPSLILYLWSLPGLKKSRRDKWIWTKKRFEECHCFYMWGTTILYVVEECGIVYKMMRDA